MSLHADLRLRRGAFVLDAAIDLADGEVVALLGPNGAGKSTVLSLLAGLAALDDGRIDVDGVVLDDPTASVFVPPEQRPIGMVFQDYLLFPHLDAAENVAFGLRARGVGRAEARRQAAAWLARVGLAEHVAARPLRLSGGQQQRVALARALATTPRVLLLDEPLAALDAATRRDIRHELRGQLDALEGSALLVTHDPVDAYALADRVLVLADGQVLQGGGLRDVAAHPRSRYVADLVGTNLVRGVLHAGVVRTTDGFELAVADTGDGDRFVTIPPSAVAIYRTRPDGSPRNVWPATVVDLDERADRVRVSLDGPLPVIAEVTHGSLLSLELRPGTEVWASVKATEITTYPA